MLPEELSVLIRKSAFVGQCRLLSPPVRCRGTPCRFTWKPCYLRIHLQRGFPVDLTISQLFTPIAMPTLYIENPHSTNVGITQATHLQKRSLAPSAQTLRRLTEDNRHLKYELQQYYSCAIPLLFGRLYSICAVLNCLCFHKCVSVFTGCTVHIPHFVDFAAKSHSIDHWWLPIAIQNFSFFARSSL